LFAETSDCCSSRYLVELSVITKFIALRFHFQEARNALFMGVVRRQCARNPLQSTSPFPAASAPRRLLAGQSGAMASFRVTVVVAAPRDWAFPIGAVLDAFWSCPGPNMALGSA